ncbi:MAG TPA: hypothetical protein VFH18_08355, partial [Erysipelotrichaceae bacterium]|nr:hypothetical protein [Erysipelotrichaceae bacterium]
MDNLWNDFDQAFEEKTEPSPSNENSQKKSNKHFRTINTVSNRNEIDEYVKFVNENKIKLPLFPITVLPQKLNMIVAPSNVGKSTYLQNIAVRTAMLGMKVLYITAEQSDKEIGKKITIKEDHIPDKPENYAGISVGFLDPLSEEDLVAQLAEINLQNYDIIVYDYIKFSTLIGKLETYNAISRLTDLFYRHLVMASKKTVFFAAIQANTTGQKINDENQIAEIWASLVDGGGGAGRHADNVVWMAADNTNSKLIIC